MKRLIFFFAVMLTLATATNTSTAQITLISSIDGTKTDTLSDAGTLYFTTPINALLSEKTGDYRLQFSQTNISGTSTYKVILQGSIDGTNFTNLHQVAGTNGVNCDTLQVTAGAPATWIFNANKNSGTTNKGRCKVIRAKFIGTGTQKTYIYGVQLFPEY
ncbi:MAG TPA: hypothetical protein PLU10_01530 [Chitinophagaceae bacterium]|jgi:hypothetical protein|nr:hypothetical protein [Chitinophagaceae bacterium]